MLKHDAPTSHGLLDPMLADQTWQPGALGLELCYQLLGAENGPPKRHSRNVSPRQLIPGSGFG